MNLFTASPRNSRNGNRDSVSTTTSTLTLGGTESVPGTLILTFDQGCSSRKWPCDMSDFYNRKAFPFLGANQNGTSVSHNGQDRASSNSSGISRLKSEFAKSFRLSSSSTSATSNTASQSPTDNNIQPTNECSIKESSNS